MTTLLALAAILISLAAAWAAFSSAKSGRRAADAAEASEKHASVSAQASLDSADAARLSAKADSLVAHVELERDHEAYRPQLAEHAFVKVRNERTKMMDVFFVFTPLRTYRVSGDTVSTNGSTSPLSFQPGHLVQAGEPVRTYVGVAGNTPLPASLRLRFWPPMDGDDGEPWTCLCGRPLDTEAHWVWNERVMVKKSVPPQIATVQRHEF